MDGWMDGELKVHAAEIFLLYILQLLIQSLQDCLQTILKNQGVFNFIMKYSRCTAQDIDSVQ